MDLAAELKAGDEFCLMNPETFDSARKKKIRVLGVDPRPKTVSAYQ